jgi:hypothetical protein
MKTSTSVENLLLQLLSVSGDIAVPDDIGDTVLRRTLDACRESGWVAMNPVAAGFQKVTLTPAGQALAKCGNAE